MQSISDRQMYGLFEELIITKRKQRTIEERLFQGMGRPIHRKWMYERVQDQYKHEKMIQEIADKYLHEKIKIDILEHHALPYTSIVQELGNRLEDVANNIQLMVYISQPIDDFQLYKMINSMMSDEYIYQTRLVKILTER